MLTDILSVVQQAYAFSVYVKKKKKVYFLALYDCLKYVLQLGVTFILRNLILQI